jgi:2-deoxy-D-gluconate 3-dehydrogenase
VRVNGIVCAQILNQSLEERIAADPNLGTTYLRGIPIGRLGRSDDIKGVSIFLASDASDWITGALIPLDGATWPKMPAVATMECRTPRPNRAKRACLL